MTALKNPELTAKFMAEAKVPMSDFNNMGIGYTAVKSDGEFFTERWHKNDMFFDRESVMDTETLKQLEPFKKKLPNLGINYSLYGGAPDFSNVTSVTMHTRYATCGREFENTHPFVDEDHSLVHNGVIDNAIQLGLNKISTCDSEAALQSYINHGVGKDITRTQAWLDSLSGYWAFGIFSRDASGTRILDIVRNSASLYASEIEDFGLVLATTPEIINKSAMKLGLVAPNPQLMKSNVLYRFNAVTGEMIQKIEVKEKPKLYTSGWMSQEERARVFGTSIPSETFEQKKTSGTVADMPTKYEEPMFANYDELWTYLEDTTEPLVDRLYAYDDSFDTDFGAMFEQLPTTMREATWLYCDFFDVVEEIELAYEFYTGKKFQA
jgi:hypothetical protein